MRWWFLGAESLGVRSMCCVVETARRRVLIDPGVALAPRRFGLPPHPLEIKKAAEIREKILTEVGAATDIVFSHFHGDHTPLLHPDPFQIPLTDFVFHLRGAKVWVKSRVGNTRLMDERYHEVMGILGKSATDADSCDTGDLVFSFPVAHGETGKGKVLMTMVRDGEDVFVHASDIQLLDEEAITAIVIWRPKVVFVDGPPIYLGVLSEADEIRAYENGLRIAERVSVMILDHHLLRSKAGLRWFDRLKACAKGKVVSVAEFVGEKGQFLEANRRRLYSENPVSSEF